MADERAGWIAVIFTSLRSAGDQPGYDAAAEAMEARARAMPGFRGIESARGADGFGITVSHWTDEAAAAAWRDDAEHRAIQQMGRDRWYERYEVTVATVRRAHRWNRP